jgi:hypothetical protein
MLPLKNDIQLGDLFGIEIEHRAFGLLLLGLGGKCFLFRGRDIGVAAEETSEKA